MKICLQDDEVATSWLNDASVRKAIHTEEVWCFKYYYFIPGIEHCSVNDLCCFRETYWVVGSYVQTKLYIIMMLGAWSSTTGTLLPGGIGHLYTGDFQLFYFLMTYIPAKKLSVAFRRLHSAFPLIAKKMEEHKYSLDLCLFQSNNYFKILKSLSFLWSCSN